MADPQHAQPYITDHSIERGTPVITVALDVPQFGLFFDGTGNNVDNALNPKLSQDGAEDAPANIPKLHRLYGTEGPFGRHYEIGIGTRTGRPNNNLDMGLALSFERRLQNGLERTRRFFMDFGASREGVVDVFGFSRGAALARAFVNEVHRINQTDLGYWGGPRLRVRFVGLFDTVASIGSPGDDRHEPFNLNLHPEAAEFVYHLTAQHEIREYFPLHSILSGPGTSPAKHFVEESLPGAHSDIGGGYGTKDDIVYYPIAQCLWLDEHDKQAQLEQHIRGYTKRYGPQGQSNHSGSIFTTGFNLTFEGTETTALDAIPGYRQTLWQPLWSRGRIETNLAHVALHKMHEKALEHGVPLRPIHELSEHKLAFEVDPDAAALVSRLAANPDDRAAEEILFRRWIHHSHQYALRPGDFINSNEPEEEPQFATPNGQREVFYNRPAEGAEPNDRWAEACIDNRPFDACRTNQRWIRT
jgi:hypothetical protein